MFRFLPEQASEIAPEVDRLNHLITDLSVFFTVAICGAMLYFAIKYKKKNNSDKETPRIEGSHALEIVWTGIPTVVCLFLAIIGIQVYEDMRHVPQNAMTINVSGKKWDWTFTYENGKTVGGQGAEFVIPVGKPVKLVLEAQDVLHSFFVPAMRVKQDAVPGKYTYVSFTPVKTGEYPVFCTEYCGTSHYAMLAKLKVVSEAEYDQWINYNPKEGLSLAALGKKLYVEKGCNGCHSVDGKSGIGPTYLKLFNKNGTYDGGKPYVADENYLRESILNPKSHIVDGFQAGVMQSYEGQLTSDEILSLISFIKEQDGNQKTEDTIALKERTVDLSTLTAAERGKKWFKDNACYTCHSTDGSKLIGPSLKNLYGKTEKLTDGSSVVVNDEYLKESILKSMAKVVEGYAPSMPPYEGVIKDDQVLDLIEYIKTIK